jgi:hypothetical protein
MERLLDIMATEDYKKVIRVIKSINNRVHIIPVRNYIDLYYKKNGEKSKEMIEYYFRIKKKEIRN